MHMKGEPMAGKENREIKNSVFVDPVSYTHLLFSDAVIEQPFSTTNCNASAAVLQDKSCSMTASENRATSSARIRATA